MALIQCKNCGKSVSDKAILCPGCGTKLMEEPAILSEKESPIICSECGTEIPSDAEDCPVCGCPVSTDAEGKEAPQKVELTSVKLPKIKKNTKTRIVACVLSVILIVVIVLAVTHANQQKTSADYAETLKVATGVMFVGASNAENAGNLIKQVWHDAIYEENNYSTRKFTHPDYYYVDFNEALSNLFSDSEFKKSTSSIQSNQESVAKMMRALQNPPSEYEEAYDAIKKFYDAYLKITNLVIDPSGSLQTYSNNFNDADAEVSSAYKAMKLYIED